MDLVASTKRSIVHMMIQQRYRFEWKSGKGDFRRRHSHDFVAVFASANFFVIRNEICFFFLGDSNCFFLDFLRFSVGDFLWVGDLDAENGAAKPLPANLKPLGEFGENVK